MSYNVVDMNLIPDTPECRNTQCYVIVHSGGEAGYRTGVVSHRTLRRRGEAIAQKPQTLQEIVC